MKHLRLSLTALSLLLAALLVTTCKGEEEEYAEPEAFSFVIYPGSRYLGELTEKTKQGRRGWGIRPFTRRVRVSQSQSLKVSKSQSLKVSKMNEHG